MASTGRQQNFNDLFVPNEATISTDIRASENKDMKNALFHKTL